MTHTDTEKAQQITTAFAPLAAMGKSDADQLIDFASTLMHLPTPTMKTPAGAEAMRWVCEQVYRLAGAAMEKAGELP